MLAVLEGVIAAAAAATLGVMDITDWKFYVLMTALVACDAIGYLSGRYGR